MWRNWSGLAQAHPTRVLAPRTTAEVAEEVARAREVGGTVKMVGTGHSFTPIAAPEQTMLRPDLLRGVVSVDRDAGEVTVLAGTPLHELNAVLEALGLTLHNMGDIAEQTVAGAISTGTHGSGGRVAGLAAQVTGLELVAGTGEVVQADATRNADLFDVARLGLGAVGVLTRVRLAVEPLVVVRAVEEALSWDEALATFDERAEAADHVDGYWFPHSDRVQLKQNTRTDLPLAAARPLSRWAHRVDDGFLQNTLFGALTDVAHRAPRIVPRLNRTASRLLSDRTYSDVPHRVFTARRSVVFREMEYAVPREAGLSALREVRRALERSDLRISFPVELRTAPADDVALSTAQGRDSFYLALHTHRHLDHRPYFDLVEPVLRGHGGRPHWGKLHSCGAAELATAYPRFGAALAVRDRLDPDRVFTNAHLRHVLGD